MPPRRGGTPQSPSVTAPLCGGEPRRTRRKRAATLRRGAKSWRTLPPLPQPERKKAPSRDARRPYEAQTNPPPVWKMDQARAADARTNKGRANLLTIQADSRAPFSKWAIKGICPKRVRPHAFSLPFSRRKRKAGLSRAAALDPVPRRASRALPYIAAMCRRDGGEPLSHLR